MHICIYINKKMNMYTNIYVYIYICVYAQRCRSSERP